MSDGTPYIGFGNDTLAKQPKVAAGDEIDCPHCGGKHVLTDSNPPLLLFFKCGEKSYLAGIEGKSTMGVEADVKGSM